MSMANGTNGAGMSESQNFDMGAVRKQRSMKFSLYPSRPRTASKDSEASASRPTTPISPIAPQLPPLPLPSREDTMSYHSTPQRPFTSHHAILNETRSFTVPQAQQNLHKRPSEASRLRALNNGYGSHSSDGRHTPEPPTSDAFPRTRQPSVRRRNESPRPHHHNANSFPLQAHNEEQQHADATSARDRGLSTSSAKSSINLPAAPLRPSMSIPDYHSPDSIYSRQRNLNSSNYRPGRGLSRPESNYSTHRREPIARPTGFDSEEVRASFRSALTTNSSFLGTSGTERSSVMTKSSSATSIFGRDEGMSVDDAIGMYESGFQDSGVEDNDNDDLRPGTSGTAGSNQRRIEDLREAMNDSLVPPPKLGPDLREPTSSSGQKSTAELEGMSSDLAPPPRVLGGSTIRESTNFFRPGGIDTPSPAEEPRPDGAMESKESSFGQAPPSRPGTRRAASDIDTTRDRYGFRKKTQHVSLAGYEAWNVPYTEYLARRRKKWVALLKDNGLITDHPDRFPPKSVKVKRFIRKGIPPDWRGSAWFYYAGGPAMLSKYYGVYDDLVRKAAAGGVTETDDEIIERDLNRTFPDNVKFKPDPPEGQTRDSHQTEPETPILQSLRRVLRAFSIYNPKIGYCQSLNFIAGLLLLFMNEEKSFWMLNIVTRVYLPGTHELNLEGANVDLGVLMCAVKDMMPQVWAKIGGELDGSPFSSQTMRLPPITLCTTAWFMSCFIGTLPIETTLRVWDSFFYEGSKTLFRIALTIFKVGETEIKAVNDPMEIFQVVQTIPRRLIDANALMEACYKRRNGFGHLSQESIEKGRAERRRGYAEERARAEGGGGAAKSPARKGTIFGRKKRLGTDGL